MKRRPGFTLVELLLYTVLVSVILTFTALFVAQMSKGIMDTEFEEKEHLQMMFAMERVRREIIHSNGVNISQSQLGVNPSKLAFFNSAGSTDYIEFDGSQKTLRIKRSTGAYEPLTTDDIAISEFKVSNLSESKRPSVLHFRIVSSFLNQPFETAVALK